MCEDAAFYTYTDPFKKRRFIYARDLPTLREKEADLIKNQLDGLDSYVAGSATLNFVIIKDTGCGGAKSLSLMKGAEMATKARKDNKGRALRKGESQRTDKTYVYYYLLNEKKLQANTLDTIHTVLHPTFQLAVRDGIIRMNPSEGVMAEIKRKAGKNKGVRHALTVEQQRAFMRYTENNPTFNHWHPLFTVLLGTGCRIGEVIGLRWEDLEAGIRTVPMMDAVYEAFQKEYELQKENGFNSTVIDGMTGFIFCNRFGNIHNPQTVNRTIKRILENYNAEEVVNAKKEKRQPVIIPHFSCHHLRHTFCTRFCEQETNIKVIQAVMGHANIETTMDIYAEVTETKKHESMQELAKKLDVF